MFTSTMLDSQPFSLRPSGCVDLSNKILTQLLWVGHKDLMTSTEVYSSILYNAFTQTVDSTKPNAYQPPYHVHFREVPCHLISFPYSFVHM